MTDATTLLALAERAGNLAKQAIGWFGPFTIAVVGMGAAMTASVEQNIAAGVVGGLMLLSALEMYAERAKHAERKKWADLLATMIGRDSETTFTVLHTFDSIRPQLDEVVKQEFAAALRAQAGEGASDVP